jgi:glycosyltransferase 2 family protein
MRQALSLLVKAVVSGILLYFALSSVNFSTVLDRLSQANPGWIGAALLVLLAQTAVVAARWRLIVIACGSELPFASAFRFSMIAMFFNQTLPSSVGGDAARIWLLGKPSGWRVAGYSVFLDRVIGVVALAILVIICLPWTLELVTYPVGRAGLLLIGFGALAAGLVFLALSWPHLSFLQRWSPTRHLTAVSKIAKMILLTPRSLVPIFVLSILIHLLTALAAWCAARSVDANLSLLYSLFLVLPVLLVTVIPISIAGWGVRESAMVAAFAYAGLPQTDGLIVSLLYGFSFLVVGVLGGIFWIVTVDRSDRKTLQTSTADS